MNTEAHSQADAELHGTPILIHREGAEGALAIDSLTGKITTPINERPDWSEGLAVADLAERHGFYSTRLGPDFAAQRLLDNPIDYRDLGWVGVDATGELLEIEADSEFRMDVIAEATGTVRTDDLDNEEQHEDIPGQQAYVMLDESHEYTTAAGEDGIVSKTYEEKLADAAPASEKAIIKGR